jgi:hypothetical protein
MIRYEYTHHHEHTADAYLLSHYCPTKEEVMKDVDLERIAWPT